MSLDNICKKQLQVLRYNNGWDSLLSEVSSFCDKHHIQVYNMNEMYVTEGMHNGQGITNMHHFHFEMFYIIIVMQLQ